MLAGIGIAAVVAWEAGAALLIGNCFRSGNHAIGVGAMLLLVLAMGLTFRYELRLHVGGQADLIAQRTDAADKRTDVREELDRARKRRDQLSQIARPTPAQREEIRTARARIADLERKWDTRVEAIAEPMPEAAWAARMTGWSEQLWRDIWLAIPLAFWMLARVFSLPMAVVGMMAFKPGEEPRGAAKAVPAPKAADKSEPPATAPQEKPQKAPMAVVAAKPTPKPKLVVSNPPRPHSKAERLEAVDAITRRWLEQSAAKSSLPLGTPARDLHEAYSTWCEGFHVKPVNASHFGRSLKRIGVAAGKTANGARYGLRLKKGGTAAKVA